MHATTVAEAQVTKRRLRLKLSTSEFDRLVRAFVGDLRDYEVAALFGMDDSEWSLVRSGKRYLPVHVLVVCAFELFPAVLINSYASPVDFQPREARS